MKKNRKYGLIGKNIDYSFSKKFFSEKFEKENEPKEPMMVTGLANY